MEKHYFSVKKDKETKQILDTEKLELGTTTFLLIDQLLNERPLNSPTIDK